MCNTKFLPGCAAMVTGAHSTIILFPSGPLQRPGSVWVNTQSFMIHNGSQCVHTSDRNLSFCFQCYEQSTMWLQGQLDRRSVCVCVHACVRMCVCACVCIAAGGKSFPSDHTDVFQSTLIEEISSLSKKSKVTLHWTVTNHQHIQYTLLLPP